MDANLMFVGGVWDRRLTSVMGNRGSFHVVLKQSIDEIIVTDRATHRVPFRADVYTRRQVVIRDGDPDEETIEWFALEALSDEESLQIMISAYVSSDGQA